MEVTKASVKLIKPSATVSRVKGIARICLDDSLIITDLKLVETPSGKLFVAMPSKKTPSGSFSDIVFPITNILKNSIDTAIINEYNKVCETVKNINFLNEYINLGILGNYAYNCPYYFYSEPSIGVRAQNEEEAQNIFLSWKKNIETNLYKLICEILNLCKKEITLFSARNFDERIRNFLINPNMSVEEYNSIISSIDNLAAEETFETLNKVFDLPKLMGSCHYNISLTTQEITFELNNILFWNEGVLLHINNELQAKREA